MNVLNLSFFNLKQAQIEDMNKDTVVLIDSNCIS